MNERFPDGTVIGEWFYDTAVPTLTGARYVLPSPLADGRVHTAEIQALIDAASSVGGGVIVVPEGEFITGALYFKPGVNLFIEKGGVLKGSENLADYPLCETRMEGETCLYFPALINADGIDGFTVSGEGVIDGSGQRFWQAFWLRRKWNPECTNKDEQRPRLLYVSNCRNVTISGVRLQNSPYWTTHFYKCTRVKILGCSVFSPAAPIPAPSTDAVDIDACTDFLIKGCRFEVNDDAVALKGGKGPYADTAIDNGANERIIIEDCSYGFCHACLTCGSEAVHNRNIILRRSSVDRAINLLWLKMRPDTPQHYEYITVENVRGRVQSFININPWTQFFDLHGRSDIPLSYADHVYMRGCDCECDTYFNVTADEEQYVLSDFVFESLRIRARKSGFDESAVHGMTVADVVCEVM